MKFIADFHIHSRFSRATATDLNLANLYMSARIKGITVVGTGDFTHPGWFAEIEEMLVPAEAGLFRLRDDLEKACGDRIPGVCGTSVRFLLSTEISNIYKKDGRTRKNHNLLFVPDMDTARALNRKLDAIGNIRSDGRPILGLDARNLLELLLETSENGCLIPAHIWTPWFSMLGSRSGFDSVNECFNDLASHIFAVETGLSSDPPMNWRVSSLDGLTLVSNSDAHSPGKLGREANLFDTELSYPAIRDALATGDPRHFLGTYEFYPEEGKYHLDGHRKCGVCLEPEATLSSGGLCPECGKPLTLGVLYRVRELADRPLGEKPARHHPYSSLIPLNEVLAEVFGVGSTTQKVRAAYRKAVEKLGPELAILQDVEIDALDRIGIPLLGEAIRRMRAGEVRIQPGYDGEFGVVGLFRPEERACLGGQQRLFAVAEQVHAFDGGKPETRSGEENPSCHRDIDIPAEKQNTSCATKVETAPVDSVNEEQRRAVEFPGGPLLIVAGPGTGKTLTLTRRIAYWIHTHRVPPEQILAVTFTNKAAEEMRLRLGKLLPVGIETPLVGTFHAICLRFLKEMDGTSDFGVIDEDERCELVAAAMDILRTKGVNIDGSPRVMAERISMAKQRIPAAGNNTPPFSDDVDNVALSEILRVYQELLRIQRIRDYDDLIVDVVRRFEADPEVLERYRRRYTHVCVDEYQDINHAQYRLIRNLMPGAGDLCVIGDPDQSIYGFRGSDTAYFRKFVEEYPGAQVIHLTRNYRSTQTIIEASFQVIRRQQGAAPAESRIYSGIAGRPTIGVIQTPTGKSEAVAIGRIIEAMVGGLGMYSVDFGASGDGPPHGEKSFADFAVLFRTRAQGELIAEQFHNAGIPCQTAVKANRFGRGGVGVALAMLKLIHGRGTYGDLQRTIRAMGAGIGNRTIDAIRTWGFRNGLGAAQVMTDIRRFPVPGVNREKQLLIETWIRRNVLSWKDADERDLRGGLIRIRETVDFVRASLAEDPLDQEAYDRLTAMAGEFTGDPSGFFGILALKGDVDAIEKGAEKVSLLTMHAAKGLEFPVVFIAGCEDGLIPWRGAGVEPVDLDEEKRLFYVAMTRARELLYLSRAERRSLFGREARTEPSPLVEEIESRLKTIEKTGKTREKKEPPQIQLRLFT